ncbi:MAG: TetR/AcrR family transcriptional regulator [Intrasporangium sp.]|uniref:TetR/AcrR family transcriptional regulator n=1 Tax=Intrasporangium sp. TaxID=1925024 RepID=UPI002647253E|nr:TetR/AcrR family transcriptional regulator [Intrasporangium sp.]MDN5795147.1 TetR/AcrR family transcriptional regulator [Intrasporangium sp.]
MTSATASDPTPGLRRGPRRATYHHGDLRRALLDASLELARQGGPDAVVLREATRRVGVSANAAYRHFADRDALLASVASRAQACAADVIAEAIAAVPDSDDRKSVARQRFRAVGLGYLRFALTEPGLFRTAFGVPADLRRSSSPEAAGQGGRTPFQLLSDQLDAMVEVGALSAEQRPGAELLAWSTVHGLAMLALEGPLRGMSAGAIERIAPRLVQMVDLGLGVVEVPLPGR